VSGHGVGAVREALKWLGVMGCHKWADPASAELDALLARERELREALERTLSWLSSYPGEACMGKDGPYEQARAALALSRGGPQL
jgi:hypothetical protein